jgi:amino acid transporter
MLTNPSRASSDHEDMDIRTSRPAAVPEDPAQTQIRPQGSVYGLKRLILGPALPTAHLVHERLGKVTALAIFSSDALSSVAYATEEMLRPLFIAGAVVVAFSLILPLSLVIVGVLAILMFSYRQTIKAYPSAGGAYIVTKDNFGLIPAQVAGVALLTDYVLTVAVSVSAGVSAIIAAAPSLNFLRVPMAVAFITIIAWGNLRGVKESGRIFAGPTYLFITGVFSILIIGAIRLAGGALHPVAVSAGYTHGWMKMNSASGIGVISAVPIFLALHSLASGSTAMTGVEAISNGVPAFRPPEWMNARTTLMWMGATLGTMFLGITFLAEKMKVVPDPTERSTVIADIARAIYGSSFAGHVAFYVFQVATTLILVLAANTAFADFPRLANFHAGDNFLPRQFTTRGHRLVFSNGIIALGAVAAALVIAFRADVTRLIPFYAIGVFTSFTLSQAGMARRHLRLREPGWRHGLAVNAAGAVATAVVDAVIAYTKFRYGAWAIILLVPIMVFLLTRMNHQYEREQKQLEEDLQRFTLEDLRRPMTVLLVDAVDAKTIHALQYCKTLRSDVIAVHTERDPMETLELETAWQAAGLEAIPLKVLDEEGDEANQVARFVGSLPPDQQVNVVIPVPVEISARERLSDVRAGAKLTRALLPNERVRVTLVRDHADGTHPLQYDSQGHPVVKLAPKARHSVVVLVDKMDRAVLEAIKYAMTLGATEVWAVHAAVDPDRAASLTERWMDRAIPIPLDVVECWDRNVARALEQHVLGLAERGSEVTVVMPRRDFPRLRQRLLHDRTSRKIQRALGRYPHIDVTAVPWFVEPAQSHQLVASQRAVR